MNDDCKDSIIVPFYDRANITQNDLTALGTQLTAMTHAMGYLTGLNPTMQMDINNPMSMAEQIYKYITDRTVPDMTPGVQFIAKERQRQIYQEGYTVEHDDQYKSRELVKAAIAYLNNNKAQWPWDFRTWYPKDSLSNLIRAGALIAAEIDRILRLKEIS